MGRALACAVAVCASAPAVAWAQGGATRASQEVTVTGGALMLGSYLALLALLLGFLALIAARQRRDRAELAALSRRMDDVLGGEQ
jgi:NADPH:quinone reductase-like Zn-dependent oxidoreductase